MLKGKIIVIEGTDCSGKETQTKLLLERLKKEGIPCELFSFPNYETPTGRIVGECYLGRIEDSWFKNAASLDPKIASLYYAADRRAALELINQTLDSGKNVILNRYTTSSMGHQAAKVRETKEKEIIVDFLEKLEYELLELPKPDKIIFLHMPYCISLGLKKGRAGRADGHESSPEHLRNAEETYLWLAEKFNWDKIECTSNHKLMCLKTKEEIHEEVFNKVRDMLI
jgi:dTMP kinase